MVAAILATFIKKERAELAMMIGIGTGVIIFYFVISLKGRKHRHADLDRNRA